MISLNCTYRETKQESRHFRSWQTLGHGLPNSDDQAEEEIKWDNRDNSGGPWTF